MIDRTGIFIGAVAIFVVSLIAIVTYYYRRARNSTHNDWESLLNRLTHVDRSSIAEVALDIIDESGQQRNDQSSAILEPPQIWKLLGGMEGIEVLEANCAVLIDLAFTFSSGIRKRLSLRNNCVSTPGRLSGRWED